MTCIDTQQDKPYISPIIAELEAEEKERLDWEAMKVTPKARD